MKIISKNILFLDAKNSNQFMHKIVVINTYLVEESICFHMYYVHIQKLKDLDEKEKKI